MFYIKTAVALFIFLFHGQVLAATLEYDTNRPGPPYNKIILEKTEPALCATECENDKECKAFVYVKPGYDTQIDKNKAACFLKKNIPAKVSDKCCVSGIKGIAQLNPNPKPQPAPGDFESREQSCHKYANVAIQAFQENQDKKCGNSGFPWGADPVSHYNWCMAGNNSQSISQNIKLFRENLEICRGCESYANTAITQYKTYQANHCGNGGNAWDGNYDYHFDWCMHGNNSQYAENENRARQFELNKCQPLNGNFKIESITPYLYPTGYIQKIEFKVSANSPKPWLTGPYGTMKEGSMWLDLRVYNKTNYGIVRVDRSYSITGRGSKKDYIPTLMEPVPGQQFPSGQQTFTVNVSSGYPNIRLEAHKMVYHHPGGLISSEGFAQPGSFKCSFNYPDIEATLHIVTNNGVKSDTRKLTQFQHPSVFFNIESKNIGLFSEVPQHGTGPCP